MKKNYNIENKLVTFIVEYVSYYVDIYSSDKPDIYNDEEFQVFIPNINLNFIVQPETKIINDNKYWIMNVRCMDYDDFYIIFDWYTEKVFEYNIPDIVKIKYAFDKI